MKKTFIQDSQSLLEWKQQQAEADLQMKTNKLIEQSNDVHIYNLATEIARCLRCGLPTGDLEKQLSDEINRVKQSCETLLGYEKKMTGYWLSERTDRQMADHAWQRRLIKQKLND